MLKAIFVCIKRVIGTLTGFGGAVSSFIGAISEWSGHPVAVPGWAWLVLGAVLLFATACKIEWELLREKENKLGPDIILLPPKHRYSTVWDAPKSLQIVTRPNIASNETEPLGTRMPVFRIKNVGHAVAKNLTLKWRINEVFSLDEITMNSPRMKKYGYQVRGNSTKSSQTQGNLTTAILSNQASIGTAKLPYLVVQPNQEDSTFTEMPISVFEACEIYFAANIPNDNPYQSVELNCTVEVSCTEPYFYAPQHFNVKITARDDGSLMPGEDEIPPEFLKQHGLLPKPALKASLKFEVIPL